MTCDDGASLFTGQDGEGYGGCYGPGVLPLCQGGGDHGACRQGRRYEDPGHVLPPPHRKGGRRHDHHGEG